MVNALLIVLLAAGLPATEFPGLSLTVAGHDQARFVDAIGKEIQVGVGEPIGDTGWVLADVRRNDLEYRGRPYALIVFERSGQMWRLDLRGGSVVHRPR